MHKATKQYLQRYAEQENTALQHWPGNQYEHVLVIPCYRETNGFLTRLHDQFCRQSVLLILVVNQPETDRDRDNEANTQLLENITAAKPFSWQHGNLNLQPWGHNCATLVVQRWQAGMRIPHKQGVGLARKIGADLACWLIAQQFIRSGWIHSSDADAHLPPDYFYNLPSPADTSAALYPFLHCGGTAEINTAATLYEQALRLYVDGLRQAGSPWAFHTIGSILTISAIYYAQARGFPKKSAGEDFYLLNKLGKLAPILQMENRHPIKLQARLSDRVPFGTGPATTKIAEQLQAGEEPLWYAVEVFQQLAEFLHCASSESLTSAAKNHHWKSALKQLDWQAFINHCRKQKLTGQRRITALHHWFDAFRTLRFIHLLQRQWHPPVPLRKLLKRQP